MLVKIGGYWIDPARVVALVPMNGNLFVRIVFQGGDRLEFPNADKDGEVLSDKVAEIVNQALRKKWWRF